MKTFTALTKLEILDYCLQEHTWGEIESHTKKASSTLSVHINDLLDSGLLRKEERLYKTTKNGKQIHQALINIRKAKEILQTMNLKVEEMLA